MCELSKEQFLAVLEAAAKPKERAKKSATTGKKKKSDLVASFASEEARIAYAFRTKFKVDGADGVGTLRQLLIDAGISEKQLPMVSHDLVGWIKATITKVPSGTLMELSRGEK